MILLDSFKFLKIDKNEIVKIKFNLSLNGFYCVFEIMSEL